MNKLNRIIGFHLCISTIIAFGLVSCGKRDHSNEVRNIDSLLTALNDVSEKYKQLDIPGLSAHVDSVNSHLEYVQKNYVGYQREDMAKVFGDYRRVKKMLPDLASSNAKITDEIQINLKQLADLKLALMEHASHDAAGNKITEEYVEKAFQQETKTAGDLIAQLNQLVQRAPVADSIYKANYGKVRFWVDSIPALPLGSIPVPQ